MTTARQLPARRGPLQAESHPVCVSHDGIITEACAMVANVGELEAALGAGWGTWLHGYMDEIGRAHV